MLTFSLSYSQARLVISLTFIFGLQHSAAPSDPWSWFSASVALIMIVFACLAWRSFPAREGDVGFLVSIFFGFVAYTALVQIALVISSTARA